MIEKIKQKRTLSKLRNSLIEQYEILSSAMSISEIGSDKYEKLKHERNEIIKQLVEIERVKQDKKRTALDIAKLSVEVLTLYISVRSLLTVLQFDEHNSFTSTTGSDIAKNVIMKPFRR